MERLNRAQEHEVRRNLRRLVMQAEHEFKLMQVSMMADPRRDGRGTVDYAPDAVNATEVRVSDRWQPSWVKTLHEDPDVNPCKVIAQGQGDGSHGAALRRAYAEEHGLREHLQRRERKIAADAPDDRTARLLAYIGTSQADYD